MKKITNKNASEQGTGHYPQSDTAKLQPPDHVPDTNGQVNSHFRVLCEHTG
jgi:hypothetical protein